MVPCPFYFLQRRTISSQPFTFPRTLALLQVRRGNRVRGQCLAPRQTTGFMPCHILRRLDLPTAALPLPEVGCKPHPGARGPAEPARPGETTEGLRGPVSPAAQLQAQGLSQQRPLGQSLWGGGPPDALCNRKYTVTENNKHWAGRLTFFESNCPDAGEMLLPPSFLPLTRPQEVRLLLRKSRWSGHAPDLHPCSPSLIWASPQRQPWSPCLQHGHPGAICTPG